MALYNKYRPLTFSQVIGQEHITAPLIKAIDNGRINNAYLFSGPRGCGKTSSARIMARAINCTGNKKPQAEPCGKCESCLALAPGGGGSVDVIELDAASHGGVEDTRELRDRAFYSPAFSRYRVFIIDEAHMVSKAGFNALLKIVEEPPEHLIFIFATTEPDKVIPTIRSRTHHYPFKLLSPPDMERVIDTVLKGEKISIDPAALPPIIRAGAGSPRDTLSILDQVINSIGGKKIDFETVRQQLGITDLSLLDDTVAALAADDAVTLFSVVEAAMNSGVDPRGFSADLLDRVRDLILLKTIPTAIEKGIVELAGRDEDILLNQVKHTGLATLTFWGDTLQTALNKMKGATSARLILEITMAKMLLPQVAESDATALISRLEKLEAKPAVPTTVINKSAVTKPVATPLSDTKQEKPAEPNSTTVEKPIITQKTPPSASKDNLDLAALRSAWPGIKNQVYKTDKVIGIMLSGAEIIGLENQVLKLQHDSANLVKRLNEPRSVDNLKQAFQQTFKQDISITFVEKTGSSKEATSPRSAFTPPPERKVAKATATIPTPEDSGEDTTRETTEKPVSELSSAERIELLRNQLGAKIINSEDL